MRIIERNNQRVLTTEQVAEAFGATVQLIHNNFNYNKKHFVEGKHYIALKGDELKEFKTSFEIQGKLKHSPVIYLWTEKGVFLHAKSLNTDQAWSAYTDLVDGYFKKVEDQKTDLTALSPQLQFMIITEQRQNALEAKQKELEDENVELRQSMRHLELVVDNEVWLTDHQKADIQLAVRTRIGQLKSENIDAHFRGLFTALNTFFNVPSYSKIPRKDFEEAMTFIQGWFPKKKEGTSSR
ncbi:ORF6N domain-containing protein [Cohnella nanjingensis]|uniref:ORF6N domain-containing protein n=1 Tax=Cohnella nanjingensis TaxID=1387779 RepID=A0A7X0RSC2_9BACL|nr:ORF6N domain-containing protein [Cohnella nanjingensis]MBB6672636.1 ORF6N domain-containing protein [Cohnella nanjingensis]